MKLTEEYSGIVINQNSETGHKKVAVGTNEVYSQTFVLPSDYVYGVGTPGERIPKLSGFQVLIETRATIDWVWKFGHGSVASPIVLESGVFTHSPAVAEQVWLTAYFNEPIEVTPKLLGETFLFSIENKSGIAESPWATEPNPLSSGQAYHGVTPEAFSFNFRLLALTADSGVDFLGNPYRSYVVTSAAENVIPKEGAEYKAWKSSPQPSQFAVVSNYFDVSKGDEPAVIDGILLAPQTPNLTFSVYYSNEGTGTAETTTEEWEQKLWTRVPKTFVASERQVYSFPTPVSASFVKVEYTNLHPESYDPGNFQKPIIYKKFPIWVTDFFLAELGLTEFTARKTNVSFNALTLAYDYFLDDIRQNREPLSPEDISAEVLKELQKFFYEGEQENVAEAAGVRSINLKNNTFRVEPTANSPEATLFEKSVALVKSPTGFDKVETLVSTEEYPVQVPSNLISVSSRNRGSLVFENSLPVMYFYLTCRHKYKEVEATFEHNRAYFAAVNEIAFVRNSYTTATDQKVFAESGRDDVNVSVNDFVINDTGSLVIE